MMTPRILVVDDEVDTCHNLSDILTDLGYEVATATDGRSALELVRRQGFDLALLDLKMPDIDGLTLFREIKKLRANTLAILVTAYASSGVTEEAAQAGAWQVLPKPVDFPALLRLVEQAVGQPLVLLVDDDQDLCASLGDLLRDRGYRVALAHDTREASAQLREARFQLVLIDLKLPHGSGVEVLRQVREANPAARTVLITGYRAEMDEVIRLALEGGADAVCYKPFDVPHLLGTLELLR